MFDLATRPQPVQTAAALVAAPFDWRLCAPSDSGAPSAYPYTDVLQPDGSFVPGIDMLASYSLELEDTLQTAIILSLFSDRRAGPDDTLPLHDTERRGWVGDEYMADDFDDRLDAWGSKLWLVYFGKVTAAKLGAARFAAEQSLQWLIRDGIASRIVVQSSWEGARADRLAVRPTIYQAERSQPVYDVLWGTSIRRSTEGALQ